MDAEYLQKNVGTALADGLAAVACSNPEDPVDFLGRFLLKVVENHQLMEKVKADDEQIKKDKVAADASRAEAEKSAEPLKAERSTRQAEVDSLAKALASATDAEAVYPHVVKCVKSIAAATTVSIAVREPGNPDDEEDPSNMYYVAASEGDEWLLKESVTSDASVTHEAWKLPPPPEDEEEEEDEENPVPKPEPQYTTLVIDNILRAQNAKLWNIPRMGGYVAAPLKYASTLHENVFPPPEEPEEEEEEAKEEEEEEGEEGEEGEKKEQAEKSPEPEVEKPVPAPVTQRREMAICLDAMGQNRPFSKDQIAFVERIAQLLAEAHERTERAMYEKEWRANEAFKEANAAAIKALEEGKEERDAKIQEEVAASIAEAGEEAPEDVKTLAEATTRLNFAKGSVQAAEAGIVELSSRRIPPPSTVVQIFASVLYVMGVNQTMICNTASKTPTTPQWKLLRTFLGKELLEGLAKFDAAVPFTPAGEFATAEAIKAVAEEVDAEELKAVSVGAAALRAWILAALEVREAANAKRSREEEERLVAEEAARAEAEAAAAAAAEGEGEEGEEEDE